MPEPEVVEALRQASMLRSLATDKGLLDKALESARKANKDLSAEIETLKAKLKAYDAIDPARLLTLADDAWLRANEGTVQYRRLNGHLEVEVSGRGLDFKAIRPSAREAMHFARMPERQQRGKLK